MRTPTLSMSYSTGNSSNNDFDTIGYRGQTEDSFFYIVAFSKFITLPKKEANNDAR